MGTCPQARRYKREDTDELEVLFHGCCQLHACLEQRLKSADANAEGRVFVLVRSDNS